MSTEAQTRSELEKIESRIAWLVSDLRRAEGQRDALIRQSVHLEGTANGQADPAQSAAALEGTICTIREGGFGFIHVGGGHPDVFFHRSALIGLEFDEQLLERRISFEAVKTAKGMTALKVRAATN